MSGEFPQRFGPYVLIERLGRGGMGDVCLARAGDGVQARPLVIKRLLDALTGQAHYAQRLRHEAEVAIRLYTPHIAKVYDVGAVGDTVYFAMEYIPGWSLSQILRRCDCPPKSAPIYRPGSMTS